MKKILYFLFLVTLINCKKPAMFKGLFTDSRLENINNTFVTQRSDSKIKLNKITESPLYYYEWKTIKYNRIDTFSVLKKSDSTSFLSHRTITNDGLSNLNKEENFQLIKFRSILKNYLFFIDDFRCIYLSQDDSRSLSYGNLNLVFDKKKYLLDSNDKKVYRQLLIGYYYLKDSCIFIDFYKKSLKNKHFYVKGLINNNSQITLTQIFNPSNKDDFEGLDKNFIKFSDSIDPSALPTFELPNSNDQFIDDQFALNFGFQNYKFGTNTKKMNPLHKNIIDIYVNVYQKTGCDKACLENITIDSIDYKYENNIAVERIYHCSDGNYKFIIDECLKITFDTLEKPINPINTW